MFSETFIGKKNYSLSSGNLKVYLDESRTNNITLTNVVPVTDEKGLENEPFIFSLVNEEIEELEYTIYLKEEEFTNKTPSSAIRYNYTRDIGNIDITRGIEESKTEEGAYYLESGVIPANTTYNYELRVWINLEAGNEIMGTEYSMKIEIEAIQAIKLYKEEILNGTDPILSENLVPVTIEDDGTVKKASLYKEWYNYSNQRWANAVVLEDNTKKYKAGEIIPENNIESYFVWIPKYSYQLWDLGNYTGLTAIDNTKVHTIPIKFGLENTNDSNEGECTTPRLSGESGSCKIGDYMSHPAFLAFDSTGFWVGKFESGYRGATSTASAQVNSSDSSKLIIKPNVYSWRNITVGNAFKVSYDYLREDDSHMMKNTEWGAVAYLQHSDYGSHTSVRINNSSAQLTGYAALTEPSCGYNNSNSISCNQINTMQLYNTTIGYTGSTTGNITGIYDMAGGTHEYVMGYVKGTDTVGVLSEITNIYGDFFHNEKWKKYYDCYPVVTDLMYSQRILGDATGEMGPFESFPTPSGTTLARGSWYSNGTVAISIALGSPKPSWFHRGENFTSGVHGGIFAYEFNNGTVINATFRIVLTP